MSSTSTIDLSLASGTATLRFERGKVNALNPEAVALLRRTFETIAADPNVRTVVFTGTGKFFSFGFDVPEMYGYTQEEFTAYLQNFTSLYAYLFRFPKPVVAALNGHTIAGGCMLAMACDARVMVTGRARIALNEITFGSSVFAGSTEILRYRVGDRVAAEVLTTGALYPAEDAVARGLVDEVCAEDELLERAHAAAGRMDRSAAAWRSIKNLLQREVVARIEKMEAESIREFVDIWYSPETRRQLQGITIR